MTTVSRQRLWQLRMRAEGRCPKCGDDRRGERTHCPPCNEKSNEIGRRSKATRTALLRSRGRIASSLSPPPPANPSNPITEKADADDHQPLVSADPARSVRDREAAPARLRRDGRTGDGDRCPKG